MRTKSLSAYGVIAGLLFLALEAPAATYYVATNGVDTGTGLGGWANSLATISNAVAKAQTSEGNVVLVSNGTYLTVAQIALTNAITVRSWNNGLVDRTNTVVRRSGVAVHRVFHLTHVNALVEGLTITDGQITAVSGGAGVYIEQGGTLRNCIVANNVATNTSRDVGGVMIYRAGLVEGCDIVSNNGWRAGGVYLLDGGVVSNCSVLYNANTYVASPAGGGGGIRIANGGLATDCTVAGNTAKAYGGGVFVQTGTVENCRVIGNMSVGYGGGVNVYGTGCVRRCLIQSNLNETTRSGALFFTAGGLADGCRIENNRGYGGGGVYFYLGGEMRNCLITGNVASNYGGGVFSYGGTIANCTIVGNAATNAAATAFGGGVCVDGRVSVGYFTTILNTVMYGNTANSASNFIIGWGGTYYALTNCLVAPSSSWVGSGNVSSNPSFVNTSGGDYHVERGSPCINSGVNLEWMAGAFDLDRHPRLDNFAGIVDRGCYEYVYYGSVFTIR